MPETTTAPQQDSSRRSASSTSTSSTGATLTDNRHSTDTVTSDSSLTESTLTKSTPKKSALSEALQVGQRMHNILPNSHLPPSLLTVAEPKVDLVSDLAFGSMKHFLSLHSLTPILTFADRSVVEKLTTYVGFKSILDRVTQLTNVLGLALNIWNAIPAPVRTGILFIVGKAISKIPYVDALHYTESTLVDADRGKAQTFLVQAIQVLKKATEIASAPVSSALRIGGDYLLSTFWPGSSQQSTSSDTHTATEASAKKDIAKLNLHIIWVNVKSFHLEETKKSADGSASSAPQDQGGLHADFSLGVNIFGLQKDIGEKGRLTLVLPWAGGAILESDETIRLINHISVHNIFDLQQLDMTYLHLTNTGLQGLKFALQKFSVGDDNIVLSKMSAQYHIGRGMVFMGDMAFKLFNWQATTQHNLLALDQKGDFVRGEINHFVTKDKTLSVQQAVVDKNKGVSVTKASAKLPESSGIDLTAKVNSLNIKGKNITGDGSINAKNISLLGEHIQLPSVEGTLNVTQKSWTAEAKAALNMTFPHVAASGEFTLGYDSATHVTTFTLEKGKFAADFGPVSVKGEKLTYSHADKTFGIQTATVDFKAIDTTGRADNIRINRDGVQLDQVKISRDAPLQLLPGVSVSNLSLTLHKPEDSVTVTATTDINVDAAGVKGHARQASFTLNKQKGDYHGHIDSLDLTAGPLGFSLKNAVINGHGIDVASASASLQLKQASEGNSALTGINEYIDIGLLDMLPIEKLSASVSGLHIDSHGYHVESFTPDIPALSFSMFGFQAHVDFAGKTAGVKGKKQWTLKDMIGFEPKFSLLYPILPGLEAEGYLGASAGIGLNFDIHGEYANRQWTFGRHIGINGNITLTAGIGVNLGSKLIVALGAAVEASGVAELTDAGVDIHFLAAFDKQKHTFFPQGKTETDINYNLDAAAYVTLSGAIKVKALYFYEKTLYTYQAAKWNIGDYHVDGTLVSNNNGDLGSKKASKLGMKRTPLPDAPYDTIDGAEKDATLRSDAPIHNSAAARRAILDKDKRNVSINLRELQRKTHQEQHAIKGIENKYIALLQKKEAFANKLSEHLPATEVNDKLAAFNAKYGVEALQNDYVKHLDALEAINQHLDEKISGLARLDSIDDQQLAQKGLKGSLDHLDAADRYAKHTALPQNEGIDARVDAFSDGLEHSIAANNLQLSQLNAVMSYANFEKNTTTSEFFMQTKRKTILPVDNALKTYHEHKNKQNLQNLQQAINTYLRQSTSKRVPYVLLLRTQVDKALEGMG